MAKKQLRKEKQNEKELRRRIKHLEQAQEIVNEVAKESQNIVHQNIAAVVTNCLKEVFSGHPEGPYEFQIKFKKARNKTEAELVYLRDGNEIDPLDAGGGVLDIASFALRLACILCARPKIRRLVVLDEPFKHLQLSLRPIAAQLLMELSKQMKVQFIVVTHFQEIELGTIVRL